MFLSAKERRDVLVKKSRNGLGIFAKKDFKRSQIIFEVTGTLVTCNEDEPMDEVARANTYRFNKNWFISPAGRLGDMLNHSCEPNAKVVKQKGKLFIMSLLPITKGQEIFIDYSTILAADDSWSMHCNCGANTCRSVIKHFYKLPKKLQQTYLSLGMVPSYIR